MEEREIQRTFVYHYDSVRQKQIEEIKAKYASRAPDSLQDLVLDQMRRMDRQVEFKPKAIAISIGSVSALLMGIGMSVILAWTYVFIGIVTGLIGLGGIIVSYPVYLRVLKREREKIAPEIIRLSENGEQTNDNEEARKWQAASLSKQMRESQRM